MDRHALLAAALGNAAFQNLAPIHRMTAVIDFAISVLKAIDEDGRELDEWEALGLLEALGAIYSNMFTLAYIRVEHALVPPEGRSDKWQASGVELPSVVSLRTSFEDARYRPIPGDGTE